ncbi:MAG TPA: hypothetical protein PLC42_02570 [Parachlamydiaceae bacterium]|nr:hypothetical protein [Parachlamydiaceae bacterium]
MVSAFRSFIYNQSIKVKYDLMDVRSYAVAIPFVSSIIQICKEHQIKNLIEISYKDRQVLYKKICCIHFAVAIIVQQLALLNLHQNKIKFSAKVFAISALNQTFLSAMGLLRVL